MNRIVVVLVAVGAFGAAVPVRAEVFKLSESDGTLHFTNAPTDPRYKRMGLSSGTAAGWLRVPGGDTSRYAAEIRDAAARYGVSERLVSAVIRVESAFNPRAVSSKGARGLMQLMPETAADYGVINPYDPEENVRAGVAYLKDLLDRYDGNEELALAAYNAGPSTVDRYGQKVPPYRETRTYLKRIREATSLAASSRELIYKSVEIVDGREVPRYTNVKPAASANEVVTARRR